MNEEIEALLRQIWKVHSDIDDVDIYDVVYLFINCAIREFNASFLVPRIRFIFNSSDEWLKNALLIIAERKRLSVDAVKGLCKRIITFKKKNVLTIEVKDAKSFFEKLYEYAIEAIKLEDYYNPPSEDDPKDDIEYRVNSHIVYVWLRMSMDDAENVDRFLDKQKQFARNRTMDYPLSGYHTSDNIGDRVGVFGDCDIRMHTKENRHWDESTRRMVFTLENDNGKYQLPTILYDIDDNGVCHIYGVQNIDDARHKDNKIEKQLYVLNRDAEYANIHPGKVLALLLFIRQLQQHNIAKVIVPTLQVLSHKYHRIMASDINREVQYKRKLFYEGDPDVTEKDYLELLEKQRRYEDYDKISKLKTEEFIYLLYRVTEHNKDVEILSEIDQSDNLIVRLNK